MKLLKSITKSKKLNEKILESFSLLDEFITSEKGRELHDILFNRSELVFIDSEEAETICNELGSSYAYFFNVYFEESARLSSYIDVDTYDPDFVDMARTIHFELGRIILDSVETIKRCWDKPLEKSDIKEIKENIMAYLEQQEQCLFTKHYEELQNQNLERNDIPF